MQVWAKMVYKFEGMTDMINGCFIKNLAELLTAATGDQSKRKTLYEIDLSSKRCAICCSRILTIRNGS